MRNIKKVILIFILFLFFGLTSVQASTVHTHECTTTDCGFSITLYYPDDVPVFDYYLAPGNYHSIHNFIIIDDNGTYRMISYNISGTVYDDYYFYMNNNKLEINRFRAIDTWYYDVSSSSWVNDGWSWSVYTLPEDASIVLSSLDIFTDSSCSTLLFSASTTETEKYFFPCIADTDESLANLNYDNILILPGSVANTTDITFSISKITSDTQSVRIFETILNNNSNYYNSIFSDNYLEFWYEIPTSEITGLLQANNEYIFTLSGVDVSEYSIARNITYKGLSSEEINTQNQINAIDKQTETINKSFLDLTDVIKNLSQEEMDKLNEQIELQKQQNENDKGIIESIKEVISYLNPFSENFFVYKLIDLLIDALKSLFVPGEDYFSNYFNELMDWFSDRLGFLAYPLELILNILNRMLNINFSEPIIQIPDIIEPVTNQKLISATSFNFNSLLDNEIFNTVHTIYLIVIDAFIIFGLVNLLKHKLEEVMTK